MDIYLKGAMDITQGLNYLFDTNNYTSRKYKVEMELERNGIKHANELILRKT